MGFLVGNLALSVFGLFLFYFCLVWGEQVTDAPDFGWQSKGEDHFRSWFTFFSCLHGDHSVLFRYCLVQRPFCIFVMFSSDLWSGIFFLFCFLPLFDWEFSPFAFLPIFDWEFSPFALFSFEGKVYGELGLWLKACRTNGHDIRQSVGLTSGSGIKGMSHIISMTHMQQWWLGNFMQNWSCMHPCGHSSIKFLWSCDTRAHDSFSLFKLTQYFQNMFLYQFMHSSKSILGVREIFL